jgi:hypothetical protein
LEYIGELAQLARAPALHAGGQGFDSLILHNIEERGTRHKFSGLSYLTTASFTPHAGHFMKFFDILARHKSKNKKNSKESK